MCTLNGVIVSLAAIALEASIPGLHVDFYGRGCSMQVNCHFLNSSACGMLQGNDSCAADMVFSNIGAYIDRATGFQNGANMTGVHCKYFEKDFKEVSQNYGRE